MLFRDAVSETFKHLGGRRGKRNRLAADVTNTATTLSFDFDLTGLTAGGHLELVDGDTYERVYVWAVNPDAKTAEVERGFEGTTAQAFTAGAHVIVSPVHTVDEVMKAIKAELRSLPGQGFHRQNEASVAYDYTDNTFPLSGLSNYTSIYGVQYDHAGRTHWLRGWRIDHDLLIPHETLPAPLTATILYRDTYTLPNALSDDLEAVCGLPESAHDILPLGAAARLMNEPEARRTDISAQGGSRRGQEVTHTDLVRRGATLKLQRDERIAEEVNIQRTRWRPRIRF